MATVETNPELGRQIVEDAKRYVLYSWSVQDAINPIAVAGAEGRYFWDYDGKRYLWPSSTARRSASAASSSPLTAGF